jgi:hypothetical protein
MMTILERLKDLQASAHQHFNEQTASGYFDALLDILIDAEENKPREPQP